MKTIERASIQKKTHLLLQILPNLVIHLEPLLDLLEVLRVDVARFDLEVKRKAKSAWGKEGRGVGRKEGRKRKK
jgi:hypothetical protein